MLHRRAIAVLLTASVVVAACGGDDATSPTTDPTVETTTPTTTTAPAEPLVVLVTNDDGIAAPGIDAVVNALLALDDVEVVVVAPAENQSGSGDNTTEGAVPRSAGATASGVEGTAVHGFPADSVLAALDDLGIEPHVVVSGVNEGQNISVFAPISGTLGAARTALRRGIPAVAASAGLDELADFERGAQLVVDWVEANREALLAGTLAADAVASFNVPGCEAGEPKELVEAPLAPEIPEGVNPFVTPDCDVAVAEPPATDHDALQAGYLVLTLVPAEL